MQATDHNKQTILPSNKSYEENKTSSWTRES